MSEEVPAGWEKRVSRSSGNNCQKHIANIHTPLYGLKMFLRYNL